MQDSKTVTANTGTGGQIVAWIALLFVLILLCLLRRSSGPSGLSVIRARSREGRTANVHSNSRDFALPRAAYSLLEHLNGFL
jgi:hypothetical protein